MRCGPVDISVDRVLRFVDHEGADDASPIRHDPNSGYHCGGHDGPSHDDPRRDGCGYHHDSRRWLLGLGCGDGRFGCDAYRVNQDGGSRSLLRGSRRAPGSAGRADPIPYLYRSRRPTGLDHSVLVPIGIG